MCWFYILIISLYEMFKRLVIVFLFILFGELRENLGLSLMYLIDFKEDYDELVNLLVVRIYIRLKFCLVVNYW